MVCSLCQKEVRRARQRARDKWIELEVWVHTDKEAWLENRHQALVREPADVRF